MTGLGPATSRDRCGQRVAGARGWLSRATVLAAVGWIALLGCGATRAPEVASVQGTTISKNALAHWTRIKRTELQSSSKPTSTSSAQVRRKALAFLITAAWVEREAAAQGISVSSSEVKATYQELLNSPAGQAFAAGLKRRGLASADELLLLRLEKLAVKLRARIAATYTSVPAAQIADYYRSHASQFRDQTLSAATPAIRQSLLQTGGQRRVGAFVAAYRERWKRRTTCQPGYVIAECGNGPPLPASPG
jgi:hypothetical protein